MKQAILRGSIGGFLAGICISIGGCVYLSCDNKVVGAILFSVALLSICMMRLNLYTGKIGLSISDHSQDALVELISCLVANIAGTVLCGLLTSHLTPDLSMQANLICHNKLMLSNASVLFRAIMCGILMYIAVYVYKEKGSELGIFFCIPTFILSGFEHSIADTFYFASSGMFSTDVLVFLWIVLLGNTVGSLLFALMHRMFTNCLGN